MPDYSYTQITADGKRVKGVMTAENENDLLRRVKEQGGFVQEYAEKEFKGTGKTLKTEELADFCRQLGTLLGAGVPMMRGLAIVESEESASAHVKAAVNGLMGSIRNGSSLSVALENQNGAFPPLLIHMFRAAEESGNLEGAANTMAAHYDKQHRLDQKVKSSMLYPKILIFMLIAVVIGLVAFVIPQFQSMFDQMETLPLPTRIILGMSDLLKYHYIAVILVCVTVYTAFKIIMRIPDVRLWTDELILKLPRIGQLNRTIATARFARTLSSLYSGGVPLMRAMQITRETTENTYIASQFDDAVNALRAGGSLSDAIGSIKGFNTKLRSSVQVGEEGGSLDTMLAQMADSLDYDSEMAMTRLVAMLEPCMIIFMGIIVCLVIVGVMLPIYQSYSTIGGSSVY